MFDYYRFLKRILDVGINKWVLEKMVPLRLLVMGPNEVEHLPDARIEAILRMKAFACKAFACKVHRHAKLKGRILKTPNLVLCLSYSKSGLLLFLLFPQRTQYFFLLC